MCNKVTSLIQGHKLTIQDVDRQTQGTYSTKEEVTDSSRVATRPCLLGSLEVVESDYHTVQHPSSLQTKHTALFKLSSLFPTSPILMLNPFSFFLVLFFANDVYVRGVKPRE